MSTKEKEHWFTRVENMHPYQTLVYLGMFGSGIIFLFLLIAFLGSQATFSFNGLLSLPKTFVASSFLLIWSGYSANKILPHFNASDLEKLKSAVSETVLLGLAFSGLQLVGWRELTAMGLPFVGLPSGSFVYVLSGIHLVHLVGAMIYALILLMQLKACEKDAIKHLLLFSNPYNRMKFTLFSVYWKFMDFVWIILFITLILVV
ncbi:putative cytochrome-c oxidase transmembrane protein [Lunatimonas lonarensis]|uniref:Putative cytochrome-c oxidase transmembrane protein n=1 Tax=Lunatimonas lonarensis TaxID=1232681 RepID=R7ZRN7_9BACT|nr:cytochrome-c oxidase [Lunatimonas lonarensis]EON76785.1 putative cytochrome-c oxidase transmembrane protein [Lunatimonas lonarensis]